MNFYLNKINNVSCLHLFSNRKSKLLLNFKNIYFLGYYYNIYLIQSAFSLLFLYSLRSSFVFFCKIINLSDFISTRFFVGLCFSIRNNVLPLFIFLRNSLKGDNIEFIFCLFSPFLLSFQVLTKYSKKYRLSKLYFLKKKYLKNFFLVNK
jgi:ribosomal protein L19